MAQLGGTGAIRALDQNEISLTVSLSDLARKAAGLKIDDDKRELARAYLGDQWFARFTEIQEALAAEDRIDRLDNIEAALLACEIDQD